MLFSYWCNCCNLSLQDYSSATAVFLYLVPRGLKLILPLLQKIPRKIRVVTYMSPFPSSITPIEIVKVKTSKHADAEWPLYVYELNSDLKWSRCLFKIENHRVTGLRHCGAHNPILWRNFTLTGLPPEIDLISWQSHRCSSQCGIFRHTVRIITAFTGIMRHIRC